MKKHVCNLSTLFIFVFSVIAYSQTLYNGVGHIPASHQVPWYNAGLLQEPGSFGPVQVYIVNGNSADDYAEVEAKIVQAKAFIGGDPNPTNPSRLAIIHFLEGTYYLDTPVTLDNTCSNIVFQGAGSDRTTLVFQGIHNLACFNIYGSADSWIDVNGALNKGDKRLYPVSGTWTVNDWVHFVVENYDYRYDGDDPETHIVGQISKIDAVDGSGTWIDIKDEANQYYYDNDAEDMPLQVRKMNPVQSIGIEDLRIERSPYLMADDGHPNQINFDIAVNCWVRGVDSYKPSCSHIAFSRSTHCEVSGCYLHEAMAYCGGGWGYGVNLATSTTNCLVENNIFRILRHSLVAGGGSNCNVWTFNYSREQTWSQCWGIDNDITYRDLDLHAKWPCGHLFEQNIVEEIGADDHFGANGFYNTFVRNYCYDQDEITLKAMENWSFLGNIADDFSDEKALIYDADHLPILDLFGYKNSYTQPVTHSLNAMFGYVCELADVSYYYSSRPDFLDASYTWPAVGPETNLDQRIPAYNRFLESKKTYLADPTPKPLTFSGSLPYNQIWSGTHTLTGDVTVPAGLILTIEPGSTIRIPSGKKITVNGTLIAEGESGNMITFNSISGTWGGLNFNDSSIDADCILEYCDIQNATYGIHTNKAWPTIQYCDIHHNEYGFHSFFPEATTALTMENNSFRQNSYGLFIGYPNTTFYIENNDIYSNTNSNIFLYCCDDKIDLANNNIYNSSNRGIYLYDSYPRIYINNIYDNVGYGISCYNGSHFDLFSETNYGHNQIHDNSSYGVYIDSNSCPILGWYNNGCPSANNFYDNTTFHVYSLLNATIYAEYNSWDDHTLVYGDVSTVPYLSKAVVNDPVQQAVEDMITIDPGAKKLLNNGYKMIMEKDFNAAIGIFKTIVLEYPNDHGASLALSLINKCYHKSKEKDNNVFQLYESEMNSKATKVGGKACELYAKHMFNTKQFDKALELYSILEKQFPKTELAKKAMFDSWLVYNYQEKDEKSALAIRDSLEKDFPVDEWIYIMKTCMGEEAEFPGEKLPKGNAGKEGQVIDEFVVYANYPNPFNPETRITFDVPEADQVVVEVFDIQGRKVTTLIHRHVQPGQHTITWHGRDAYGNQAASGMYFCRVRYQDFATTHKMILMR